MYSVGVIIVSDSCHEGSKDLTGPALVGLFETNDNFQVKSVKVVPDEISRIQETVRALRDHDLILTAGGTGFSPRDVTPEVCSSYEF